MAKLLPSNRLLLCGAQKIRADKKSKSADSIITPKGTLTYLRFYQMLLLVMLVIKTHQVTEKSGTTLESAVFLAMAETKYA